MGQREMHVFQCTDPRVCCLLSVRSCKHGRMICKLKKESNVDDQVRCTANSTGRGGTVTEKFTARVSTVYTPPVNHVCTHPMSVSERERI
jgi:hypothetical protein